MTSLWFLRQGAPHVILNDGFWKSDHNFLIACHSYFLSGLHGFRDNEVLLQAGYDVFVISPPGVASRYFTRRITCSAVALSRVLRTALVPHDNMGTSTPHSSDTSEVIWKMKLCTFDNVRETNACAKFGWNPPARGRIDVLTKMVPRVDPNDVDLFFTSFERTLILNKIPEDQWPVVLNAIVFGKAQRVLSSQSLDDLHNYELVKTTLLSAFEVCADVFPKRFRFVTKNYNDSFAEFRSK